MNKKMNEDLTLVIEDHIEKYVEVFEDNLEDMKKYDIEYIPRVLYFRYRLLDERYIHLVSLLNETKKYNKNEIDDFISKHLTKNLIQTHFDIIYKYLNYAKENDSTSITEIEKLKGKYDRLYNEILTIIQ